MVLHDGTPQGCPCGSVYQAVLDPAGLPVQPNQAEQVTSPSIVHTNRTADEFSLARKGLEHTGQSDASPCTAPDQVFRSRTTTFLAFSAFSC